LTEEIWSKTIHFSEQVKDMVRKPLGDLYYGHVSYSRELAEAKPLVVVGDYTFTLLVKAGVRPSVAVLDAKIERGTVGLPPLEGYRIVKVRNNPGTISPEAAEAVTEAVRTGNVAVVVEGEEDLLALPAIYALPETGVLVYGQPKVGYVVVRGGEEARRKVVEIVALASRT
jgi:uncharacterized protein (UPF0218 family)